MDIITLEKHSSCEIDVCDNEMRYPKLHKKHSNEDEQTSNPLAITDNSRKSSCELFPEAREGASHQPAFMGSCLLVTSVCPVYLVDELKPCVLRPLMIGLMVVLLTFLNVWFYFYGVLLFYGIGVEFKDKIT